MLLQLYLQAGPTGKPKKAAGEERKSPKLRTGDQGPLALTNTLTY